MRLTATINMRQVLLNGEETSCPLRIDISAMDEVVLLNNDVTRPVGSVTQKAVVGDVLIVLIDIVPPYAIDALLMPGEHPAVNPIIQSVDHFIKVLAVTIVRDGKDFSWTKMEVIKCD